MDDDNEATYRDLIETAARAIAFHGFAGWPLPQKVAEIMADAADLRNGWEGFAAGSTAPLPIVDAVIDEVHSRADELRGEFVRAVLRTLANPALLLEPTTH